MLTIAQHALYQAATLDLTYACATSSTPTLQDLSCETLKTATVLASTINSWARPGGYGALAADGTFHAVTVAASTALEGA